MCFLQQRPTQVVAELPYHAVGVSRGNLGKAGQNEDIAVFQRSLVHGLKEIIHCKVNLVTLRVAAQVLVQEEDRQYST